MNRVWLRYLVFFIVAFILQFTVIKYLQIYYWKPDLLLILVVFFAYRYGQNWGMTVGFLAGLTQDLLSAHVVGVLALSKTIAAFIAGSFQGKVIGRSQFLLLLFGCGFAHDLIYFFFNTLGENFSLQSLFLLYTIPNLVYTLIIGFFVFYLFEIWQYE